MDNYKLIIKDKDLFDLFFNNVPYIWQALDRSVKQDQAYQPTCLYKESVQVIRAINKFVDDLKSGSLPRATQLGISVTGHAEFDPLFLVYFKTSRIKFRFNRNMRRIIRSYLNRSICSTFSVGTYRSLSNPATTQNQG